MTQSQRREYLIRCLLQERPEYAGLPIPMGEEEQRRLLRSLMNLRPPAPISGEFLRVQDAYLRERLKERGVTQLGDLRPAQPGLYLWQGDITTLAVDVIVNAANSGMTGCYVPCHGCIDNAIHTFAGVRLRLESARPSWQSRTARSPRARRKSPKPTTCPAGMCSTPWGPSCTAL